MPDISSIGATYTSSGGTTPNFGAYQSAQRGLNLSFSLLSDYVEPQPIIDTGSGTSLTGWDLVGKMTYKTGLNTVWCFALTTPETNVSKSYITTLGGVGCSGSGITVLRVVGMARFGKAAVRQFVAVDNQAAGGTPEIVFPKACLPNNPVIFFVADSTAPPALTAPAGFALVHNSGYNTPTTGGEMWKVENGFSGTTITGGEAPLTDYGVIGVELDASPLGPSDHPVNIVGRGGMR